MCPASRRRLRVRELILSRTAVRDTNATSRSVTNETHRIVPTSGVPIDLSSALPRLLPLAVELAEFQSALMREAGVALDPAAIQLARSVGVDGVVSAARG